MAIQFRCERCQQLIEVDDEAAGHPASCPFCNGIVMVPNAAAAVPAASQTRPSPTLQTAVPVPYRPGAPMTNHAGIPASQFARIRPPAVIGYMALATLVVTFVLFIIMSVGTMPEMMKLMQNADPKKLTDAMEQLILDKPWIQFVGAAMDILGFASLALATVSLIRRERPLWPACVVLGLLAGAILMSVMGLVLMSAA